MKTTLFAALAIVFFSCNASAQKLKSADVPAAVKASFEKAYPAVKDVDWEKEGENYEAEFEVNKQETSVVYNAAGTLLETETEISTSALPSAAVAYVAQNYPKEKIKEAAKITAADGTITYEAELRDRDLIFDANGQFLKEVKKADERK